MNFLLIYPEIRTSFPNYTGGYSEGVASILTVLRELGHKVKLLHITQPQQYEQKRLFKVINEFKPDLIAFSSMSPNYPHARRMNELIKAAFNIKTAIGGCHAQFSYQKILANDNFDFICVGEGEAILPPLLEALENNLRTIKLPGIISPAQPELLEPERCLVDDLDSLPFPDRSFFDYENLRESKEFQAQFMAGRGCPFECSYCANKFRADLFKCKTVRMKSPERFIAEMQTVLSSYSFVNNVFFQDDILPINRKWFKQFAELYIGKISLPFACNIHPSLIDEDVLLTLKDMGCKSIQIGVESGSDEIRRNILKRRMTNDEIIQKVKLCQQIGIETATFNMLGNHRETFSQALETIKLNAKLGPVRAYSTIFIPYPGTSINQICNDEKSFVGGSEPEDFPEYTEEPILVNPEFPPEKVVFLRNWFGVLVRLYKIFPEKKIDRILHKKRFPFKLLNKLIKRLRPLAIRLYLGLFVKLRNRFN